MASTLPLPRRRRSSVAWRRLRASAPFAFLVAACLLSAGAIRVVERGATPRSVHTASQVTAAPRAPVVGETQLGSSQQPLSLRALDVGVPSLVLEPVDFDTELDLVLSTGLPGPEPALVGPATDMERIQPPIR